MLSNDASNLREVIEQEYKQFSEGIAAAKDVALPGKYTSITISGMGGSALPGNILRIFLHSAWRTRGKESIGVHQNRFYSLPPEAYKNSLNFFCSHSGNTEETIASLEEAIRNNLPSVGMAAGGKVESICREHSIPFVKLPVPFKNFQPRMATGHFVSAFHTVLANSSIIESDEEALLKSGENLQKDIMVLEEKGRKIADILYGKTPIIYSNTYLKSLAMIWKIKLNENSKTPAFWNYFPELNHNEMVGFTLPQAKFVVVMLKDPEDHPRNLKRYIITEKILKEKGVEVLSLDILGKTVYDKVFSTLVLGDWASYFLAFRYGIDPTPVVMVEDLKRMLNE